MFLGKKQDCIAHSFFVRFIRCQRFAELVAGFAPVHDLRAHHPRDDRVARAIGLEFGPRLTVMTAAGPVRGWMTRLDSVQLGALALSDVRATIAPGLGDQALLGMSFLKHFSIVQEGETLVIALPGVTSK